MIVPVIVVLTVLIFSELQRNTNLVFEYPRLVRRMFYLAYCLSAMYIIGWWYQWRNKAVTKQSQVVPTPQILATHFMTVPLLIFASVAFFLKIYNNASFQLLLLVGMEHAVLTFLVVIGRHRVAIVSLIGIFIIRALIDILNHFWKNITEMYLSWVKIVLIYQVVIIIFCYKLRPVKNRVFSLIMKTLIIPLAILSVGGVYLKFVGFTEMNIPPERYFPVHELILIFGLILAVIPTVFMIDWTEEKEEHLVIGGSCGLVLDQDHHSNVR